jgi:hypothetical protein
VEASVLTNASSIHVSASLTGLPSIAGDLTVCGSQRTETSVGNPLLCDEGGVAVRVMG